MQKHLRLTEMREYASFLTAYLLCSYVKLADTKQKDSKLGFTPIVFYEYMNKLIIISRNPEHDFKCILFSFFMDFSLLVFSESPLTQKIKVVFIF